MAVKASAAITVSIERDIQGTWRFYRIASSSSTPSAPTTAQGQAFVNSGTVPSGWSKVEPAYDGTSTNSLYTVDLTAFTDGSVVWTDVSKSSSYEASKQAYNKASSAEGQAQAAQDTADSVALDLATNYDSSMVTEQKITEAVAAETAAREASELAKIDRTNGNSRIEWVNGIFKIIAIGDEATYSTEIGGDGIEFKHNDMAVASIDQDRLVIDKTVVLDEMQVGNNKWTWKIDPDDNSIFLKWIG